VQYVADGGEGIMPIPSAPFPDWITVAGDSAWVANAEDGVARYDLATGALIGSAPTGVEICLGMDATDGALWLGDCSTRQVVRVDLATGQIVTKVQLDVVGITAESSVAAGPEGVFVLCDGATKVVRIDPATNKVSGGFDAPEGAAAMRLFDGELWITDEKNGAVHAVDPQTGDVLASVETGAGARFIAAGEGSVWVLNNRAGTVSRVDPSTREVVATIPVSNVGIYGGDIAVGDGSVFVQVVADAMATQIDVASNTVVARFGPPQGSGGVAANADALWISVHDVQTVYRIALS